MYSSTILLLDLGRLHSVWVKDLFQHELGEPGTQMLLSACSFSLFMTSPSGACPHCLWLHVELVVSIPFGMASIQGKPCPAICLNQLLLTSSVIFLFLHGKGGFSRCTGRFVAHVAVENFVQPFLCSSTAFLLVPPDMQWEGSCWQLSQVCTVLIPAWKGWIQTAFGNFGVFLSFSLSSFLGTGHWRALGFVPISWLWLDAL